MAENLTAAEKAYAFAEKLINEAIVGESDMLDFDREETHALEVLPPEIADAVSIETLNLDRTQVADLAPIAGLHRIETLFLDNTQVADLAPIAGLSGITWLTIDNTQVADLAPIAGLRGITTLTLTNTQVTDLAPIAGLSGITTLTLSNTQVTDLAPIAGLSGITTLSLTNTKVTDLAPIAGMSGITWLDLNNTQVTDLAPIAGMSGVARLDLSNTQISNLRPVLTLTQLVENPKFGGLQFKGTAACEVDPRIAEIAEIEDTKERAATLFEYLADWVPPESEGGPLAPDAAVPIKMRDGKVDVDDTPPDSDDPLHQALHKLLQEKVRALANAAGNQFPRLCATARSVLAVAEKPFADVDLLTLFLDNEALKDWQDAGQEDGQAFPEEVTIPLAEVIRPASGLTLGDPQIDLLIERINRSKGIEPPADEAERQSDMADVIKADEDAVGELLRHQQKQLDNLNSNVAFLVRKTSMRNVFLIIAGGAVADIALSVTGNALSAPVIAMVEAHWPVFVAAAETYSAQMAHYFASSMTHVPGVAEQAKATLEYLRKRREE